MKQCLNTVTSQTKRFVVGLKIKRVKNSVEVCFGMNLNGPLKFLVEPGRSLRAKMDDRLESRKEFEK